MSQRDVESLLGRLVTDAQMRRCFFEAPEAAIAKEYNLSPDELAPLIELGEAPLATFATTVDASIMRAGVAADVSPNLLPLRSKL